MFTQKQHHKRPTKTVLFTIRPSAVLSAPRACLLCVGAATILPVIVTLHARSASQSAVLQSHRMQIVGHRGASAVAPENTLAAIRSALETGYGFEVDLQLLRTQEVCRDTSCDHTLQHARHTRGRASPET